MPMDFQKDINILFQMSIRNVKLFHEGQYQKSYNILGRYKRVVFPMADGNKIIIRRYHIFEVIRDQKTLVISVS